MRLVRLGAAVTVALLTFLAGIRAEPIPSDTIQVLDGDTIATRGKTVRLVGFDTPEGGMNARCEPSGTSQVARRANCASSLPAGAWELTLVPCSCPAGKEGTPACNYGRACGVLTAAGKDVSTPGNGTFVDISRLARESEAIWPIRSL